MTTRRQLLQSSSALVLTVLFWPVLLSMWFVLTLVRFY